MYEEYLEDFVYKLMSKVGSRICRMFKPKREKDENKTCLDNQQNASDAKVLENSTPVEDLTDKKQETNDKLKDKNSTDEKIDTDNKSDEKQALVPKDTDNTKEKCDVKGDNFDEDLNNINFHLMMFFLWMVVTIVNIPALLTWARNFKYSMVLKPDTSYHTGFVMSVCSAFIWQMNGPQRNLRNYEATASLLFTMAVFILALGPFSLSIVNYGITFMFTIITIQQLYDIKIVEESSCEVPLENTSENTNNDVKINDNDESSPHNESNVKNDLNNDFNSENDSELKECDVCNENRIYSMFKNLRDKFSFTENT